MHWLYLLLALGALVLAFTTSQTWLLTLCLLAALGLMLKWIMAWYAHRVGDGEPDVSAIIDPAELRQLRERAEARKRGQDAPTGTPPA